MAFRVTGTGVPVLVQCKDGGIEYHNESNPIIPWLNGLQAARYLRLGVVEHISEEN